jgi:hypothetical protein
MSAGRNIARIVARRNGETALEAFGEVALGVLFTALTFGVVYWLAWVFGFFGLSGALGMRASELAAWITGVLFVVAVLSAWRQVDPLQSLPPLTQRQELLTTISMASPNVLYFSPRHASAGVAMLLLGGPVNVMRGVGAWRHRVRWRGVTPDQAGALLARCERGLPLEQLDDLAGALLLRRLALIRVTGLGGTKTVELTEKGRAALHDA